MPHESRMSALHPRTRRLVFGGLIIACLLFIGTGGIVAFRSKAAADAKFREEIRQLALHPDIWDQMCRNPEMLYTYGVFRDGIRFSVPRYEWIRKDRQRSITAIRELMAETFGRMEREITPESDWKTQADISTELASYYAFLLDLNACESLPELLDYELRLRRVVQLPETPSSDPPFPKIIVTGFGDRILYANLLSVILAILYQEKHAEIFESDVHQEFERIQTLLKGESVHERFVSHDLTVERRDQIIRWANDFLKSVPESKRLGPKGMIPVPVER